MVFNVNAAEVVVALIAAADGQEEIEAARAAYNLLLANQQSLVTNENALDTKEQNLVDGVTLAVTATYDADDAGTTVVVDPQTGFTYSIISSSNTAVVADTGEIAGAGTATLTYTVTHTASGKTSTEEVEVTVDTSQ